MLKNVTLSADNSLIALARERAQKTRTTLNAAFREWLQAYVGQDKAGDNYRQLVKDLKKVDAGRKHSRDEMNER